MSPLDRIRWNAAVAARRLPTTAYRLAAHLTLLAVDGVAWASKPTLATAIGVDEARLPDAFRSLVKAGFLKRGRLDGPPGRQTYRWHLVQPTAEPAPGAEVAPPAETALPALVAPGAEVAGSPPAEVTQNPLRKSPPKGGSKGGSKGGYGGALAQPSAKRIPTDPPVDDPGMDFGNPAGPDFALRNGSTWRATRGFLDTMARAFPGIDLPAELAKAAAWCAANPAKRKTVSGMPRFLNTWLSNASTNRPRQRTTAMAGEAIRSGPTPSTSDPDALAAAAEIDRELAHVG